MTQSITDLEAEVAAHQRAADAAWQEYNRRTKLAVWCETRLAAERRHDKRVTAVDEALRRTG